MCGPCFVALHNDFPPQRMLSYPVRRTSVGLRLQSMRFARIAALASYVSSRRQPLSRSESETPVTYLAQRCISEIDIGGRRGGVRIFLPDRGFFVLRSASSLRSARRSRGFGDSPLVFVSTRPTVFPFAGGVCIFLVDRTPFGVATSASTDGCRISSLQPAEGVLLDSCWSSSASTALCIALLLTRSLLFRAPH